MNILFYVISGLMFVWAGTTAWHAGNNNYDNKDHIYSNSVLLFIASALFALAGVLS